MIQLFTGSLLHKNKYYYTMNDNKHINKLLPGFSELVNVPVIISKPDKLNNILYINKAGIELAGEIFDSTEDFLSQATSFTGLFQNIINYNNLGGIYKNVLQKNKGIDDVFITFSSAINKIYSLLLKISPVYDEDNKEKLIITSINNVSEISSYRTELYYSRKYLEGFIEAFARDRMVYLLSYEHEETVKHLMEVREFSKLIAIKIMQNTDIHRKQILEYSKITPIYIKILEISALLHDFGKVHNEINQLIRLPRKLTEDEYSTVKKHTGYGADLIGDSNDILRMCRLVAKYHHEKWDGSGYPDGLLGNEIPLSARIVAFADMFSALRDERAYKKAITDKGEIISIFYQCEKHFDPIVFQTGIELIPEMLAQTSKIDSQYKNLKITSDTFLQFFRGIITA